MPYVFDCDHPHDRPAADVAALVGGKAANLSVMTRELGLPVPPAFTVSTEACREYLVHGWPSRLDEELRTHMARMERQVGHGFGDPADPLLVSVRSGAPVSMPGMMDTILNLGLNDATTAGLAVVSGSSTFAASCRARFESMYRDIVGVDLVPADPWLQLRAAIEAVFRSWMSPRAKAYRERESIPEELGTGVTVQAMVFGNRSTDSATGVLFTRNPATGERELYGDILFNAQGEDVVAGTHATEPITALDERLPAVARQLREAVDRLERYHRDVCDIEFTIERGRLWLLQCRIGKRSPRAALRIAVDMAEDPTFPLTRAEAVQRVRDILADPPLVTTARPAERAAIATGLPASPGLASGTLVVTPEAAVEAAARGRPVILARAETSPDDVHGMAAAAGVLTSTGGLASHAAVVARGWGIPAVVGAAEISVDETGLTVGGRHMPPGSPITIDGTTGAVYEGLVDGSTTIVPEAAVLLRWARELGLDVGGPAQAPVVADPASDASDAQPPGGEQTAGPELADEDVLVALLVKGYATPDEVATALGGEPGAARSALDRLAARSLVEPAAGSLRLTAEGRTSACGLVERAAAAWGHGPAEAALEAFVALDRRMKDVVTAWQMREIDGQQVINDHTDAAYDARPLAELAELHAAAATWLEPLVSNAPRLETYAIRLDRANAAAQAGDGRFVASPRVDSYHSVWFELHEYLILHAGHTRAEEVKAGRA